MNEKRNASVFDLNGIPKMSQTLPLALQHVVAMIVGCVTPAIIDRRQPGGPDYPDPGGAAHIRGCDADPGVSCP